MREQDPSAAAATIGAAAAVAEGQGGGGGGGAHTATAGQLHAGQDAAAVDSGTGHTGHDTAVAARLWMPLLGGRNGAEGKGEEEEAPYPCTSHIAATVVGLSSHCTSSNDVQPSSTPKSTGARLWLALGGMLLELAALPIAAAVAAGATGSGVGARKARCTIHGDNTGVWCPFMCVANRDRRSAYRPRASSHRDCSTASKSNSPSTPCRSLSEPVSVAAASIRRCSSMWRAACAS